MKGFDLVSMGRFPHNHFSYSSPSDINLVNQIFSEMAIGYLSDKLIQECSDGELQLLCVARAVVQSTPVMLLDEITSHLDVRNTSQVMELLSKWVTTNSSCIIMATHDLHTVKKYSSKVLLFKEQELRLISNVDQFSIGDLEQLILK